MYNDSLLDDIDQLEQLLDSPIRSHHEPVNFSNLSFSEEKPSLMEKERTR